MTPAQMSLMTIGIGVLILLISLPLLKGKVPMNCWYGIRFRESFASRENWYLTNAYGAQRLILWSLAVIALGIAGLLPALQQSPGLRLMMSLVPLLYLVPLIESYLFARRLGILNEKEPRVET